MDWFPDQWTDQETRSMDWFLYDRDLRHERINYLGVPAQFAGLLTVLFQPFPSMRVFMARVNIKVA